MHLGSERDMDAYSVASIVVGAGNKVGLAFAKYSPNLLQESLGGSALPREELAGGGIVS